MSHIRYFKELFKINPVRTLIAMLKSKSRVIVYKGGKIQFDNKKQLSGKAILVFNCSQYKDNFYRSGHFWISKTGKVATKSGIIIFYSGCKVDVNGGLLELGDGVTFNENCRIGCKSNIKIGDNCLFGDEVSIHDFDGHKIDGAEGIKPIAIGNNVWVGERVTILKGVTIKDNVIVGANSVVTKDLESGFIYCGNPAVAIKSFSEWQRR